MSSPKGTGFAGKHPKAAKFFDDVNEKLKQIKEAKELREQQELANAVQAAKDAEKVRILEAKVKQQQSEMFDHAKKAKQAERQSHVDRGNAFQEAREYSKAIAEYRLALAVQIPGVVQSNRFFPDADPANDAINQMIKECKIAIQHSYDTKVQEAHTDLSNNNVSAARIKIAAAKNLWANIGNDGHSTKILELENRLEWVEKKPVVLAESNNLAKTDVDNIDPGSYPNLVLQLETCLDHYRKFTGRLTADELSLRQKLESVLKEARAKIEQGQLLASWQKKSKATNKIYRELIAMNLEQVNLESMRQQLAKCLEVYNAHQLQLSKDEIEHRNELELLLENVHAALKAEKRKQQRAKDRIKHVGYEADITKGITKLKASLRIDQLEQALEFMNEIVGLANLLVGHADDITEKKYAQRGYFDETLEILKAAEGKYRASRDKDAKAAAEDVIATVLANIVYNGDCERAILPRHRKRLIENLTAELKAQWFKFYDKLPDENKIPFDYVVDQIVLDMIETTRLQRWTPFNDNWTNAAFCIKKQDDRSTKLIDELRDYLKKYQPSTGASYTELPIIPSEEIRRNESLSAKCTF